MKSPIVTYLGDFIYQCFLSHWGECLGKAQGSDELEPGELPDGQSPFDLRVMGRGLRKRCLAFLRLHERNHPGEIAGNFFAPPLCAFSALQEGALFLERVI